MGALFVSPAGRRALSAWSGSLTGRVFRQLGAVGTGYVPLRHRFIDEHPAAALNAGAVQVGLLGAGYDTRAYRFADQLAGRPVFEVDLAAISRAKASTIARNGASALSGDRSQIAHDMWNLVDEPSPYGTARRAAPGALSLIGEPVTFGVHPEDYKALLERHGFAIVDLPLATRAAGPLRATLASRARRLLYILAAERMPP